ncbi:MAG: VOC family protein [Candidatus Binatia bacterium]
MPISVQKIVHINANCIDIAAARRFFEDVIGLTAANHLKAAPQSGAGMGLSGEAQWDGYAMQDANGWAGTMLDLLQWTLPPTELSPGAAIDRLGYSWAAIDVPDVAATIEHGRQWPLPIITDSASDTGWLQTPDGLPIEIRPGTCRQTSLAYVAINCRDLARTRAWYTTTLGFQTVDEVHTRTLPAALAGSPAPLTVQVQGMTFTGRAHSFGIQLVQRTDTCTPRPPRTKANAHGLFRLAVAVEDVASSYRRLQALGADCPLEPCWLQLGPEAPVEGVWALFFRDPDGTCVELIQTPPF